MARLGLNSNYGTFNRLEKSVTSQAIGRQAQRERGIQANLASRGLADSPGIAADLSGRENVRTLGVLSKTRADIGIAGMKFAEQRRQFDDQMQFRRDLEHNRQKDAKRRLWIEGISSLIGAISGPVGAAIEVGSLFAPKEKGK